MSPWIALQAGNEKEKKRTVRLKLSQLPLVRECKLMTDKKTENQKKKKNKKKKNSNACRLFSQTKPISNATHDRSNCFREEKMKKEKAKCSSLETSTRGNFFMTDLTFCTKEISSSGSVVQVRCMIIIIIIIIMTPPCQILHGTTYLSIAQIFVSF